jgi:hypothetical protein
MDEKQLLAVLIDTLERQSAENARLLAAVGKATQAMEGIIPAVQKTAGEVISVEARVALAGAATGAIEAAGTLKKAAQWFGWRVFALAAVGMAGVCLVAWGSIWWPRHQIAALIEQKAELQGEVAELQTNVANLEKKGGKIKMNTCGPKKRLCVEVDPDQEAKGWEDFKGPFSGDARGTYIIPKGY